MAALDAVRKNTARLLACALFVAGLVYLGSSGVVNKQGLQAAVEDNKKYLQQQAGAQGMALFVIADIVLIVACLPLSFAMELAAGYIYGLMSGVALILIAKLVAAGVCFYLGKFMFADWVNSMLKENATFKTLKKKTGSSGFMLVLGLRLSPVPSYLCSYCASVMSVPFSDYMKATAACTAPMVVNNVYMGQALSDFQNLALTSGGGIGDYVKLALPLIGTLVLCEWIRRFMSSLAPGKKKASGKGLSSGFEEPPEGWVRRSSRPTATKTPQNTPSKTRGKSPARATSPASARGKSPSRRK